VATPHHIGALLRHAVKNNSAYTIREVCKLVDRSNSTLHRWFNAPNPAVRDILLIVENCPKINLRRVFEALEENLGEEVAGNPYRNSAPPAWTNSSEGNGLRISLDANVYGRMKIPPDLHQHVHEYIESYQVKGKDD